METISTQSTPSADGVASLSEQVMPAVRGEFYSYAYAFSKDKPLYFLLHCKSQKGRPLTTDVEYIVKELDLTFIFGDEVILCSPNSAHSMELLGSVIAAPQKLNQSEIRVATITENAFYDCYYKKEESFLVDIYRSSGASKSSVVLSNGLILSVKTSSGKYGLILIKELTPSTCMVDACHILL